MSLSPLVLFGDAVDQPWLCCRRRGAAALSCGITTAWLVLVDAQGLVPALGNASPLFVSPVLCELAPSHGKWGLSCSGLGAAAAELSQCPWSVEKGLGLEGLGRGFKGGRSNPSSARPTCFTPVRSLGEVSSLSQSPGLCSPSLVLLSIVSAWPLPPRSSDPRSAARLGWPGSSWHLPVGSAGSSFYQC